MTARDAYIRRAMKKPLPVFQKDEEAERFIAEADLTEYDLSPMRVVRFEFQPKSEGANAPPPK
jgi:predicted DNA binding CopG/RHH family protein